MSGRLCRASVLLGDMDAILYGLIKIGLPTAVAGFVDWLMSRSEKERLRGWLETWWLRFNEVRWRSFGRAEVERALVAFDRYAGRRLLSRQRLIVTLQVVGAGCILAGALTMIMTFRDWGQTNRLSVDPIAEAAEGLVLAMLFAVSLSLTRGLSAVVLRVPPSATNLAFVVLALVHLFLLVVWRQITLFIVVIAVSAAYFLVFPDANIDFVGGVVRYLKVTASDAAHTDFWLRPDVQIEKGYRQCMVLTDSSNCAQEFFIAVLKLFCDVVANGLRLAFSLVFLASFVFRPVIQPAISRAWARIVESDKPVFTLVVGGLSAAIVLGRELAKLL